MLALTMLELAILYVGCAATSHSSIQAAVDAAPDGAKVKVCRAAGPYQGPVVIRKPLILEGETGAEIRAGGSTAIITIASFGVEIADLTLTGGKCDAQYGVDVQGGTVRISGLSVRSIHGGPACDQGTGIRIRGRAAVLNTRVADVAQDGIAVTGEGSSAELHVNWINGGRNGIAIANGATGIVIQNTVTNAANGVLLAEVCGEQAASGSEIRKNTLAGNQVSIQLSGCNEMNAGSTSNVISSNLVEVIQGAGSGDKLINNRVQGAAVAAIDKREAGSTLRVTTEVSQEPANTTHNRKRRGFRKTASN